MVATIFSFVFLLVFYITYGLTLPESIKIFIPFLVPVTGALFFTLSYIQSSTLVSSLEKVQRKSAPCLMRLLRKDQAFHFAQLSHIVFALYSILFPLAPFLWQPVPFFIWVFGLGIACDCLWFKQRKARHYLDILYTLKALQKEAKEKVKGTFESLRRTYDRISEVATLAIEQKRFADSDEALRAMKQVVGAYVDSYMEKGDPLSEDEQETLGSAIGYFIGPFRSMFTDALDKGAESLGFRVILGLGNLCHHIAKVDRKAASIPLHAVGAIAQYADEEGWEDISVKAFLTLQELGRVLVEDERVPIEGTGELFQMVVTHLHSLAEGAFKRDKEISLDLLMDPFRLLKECFAEGRRGVSHPERKEMVAALDRTLGEFEALELVLQRTPEMPNLQEVVEEEFEETTK